MASFLEDLGRTNALPSSIKNLSDLALSIRRQKQGEEQLDIARAGEARQGKKFKLEEIKRQEQETSDNTIVSLKAQIPKMNVPAVGQVMVQDIIDLGFNVDMSDPNNPRMTRKELIAARAALNTPGHVTKYNEIWGKDAARQVNEANENLSKFKKGNAQLTQEELKNNKNYQNLLSLQTEAEEYQQLNNHAKFDASAGEQAQQKFEREGEAKKQAGIEKERLAGEERERKETVRRQTIDSLKKTIKEIDPTASVSDDVQSLRATLASVRKGKAEKGKAGKLTKEEKRKWHSSARTSLNQLIKSISTEGEDTTELNQLAGSLLEKYRARGEDQNTAASSAIKEAATILKEQAPEEKGFISKVIDFFSGDSGEQAGVSTDEDIEFTAKKHGITPDEVRRRLRTR